MESMPYLVRIHAGRRQPDRGIRIILAESDGTAWDSKSMLRRVAERILEEWTSTSGEWPYRMLDYENQTRAFVFEATPVPMAGGSGPPPVVRCYECTYTVWGDREDDNVKAWPVGIDVEERPKFLTGMPSLSSLGIVRA